MTIRCLIVDDIEENRDLLEEFLRGNGYEIMTACNGAEALEKARANPPQIIISDILMPVMDGYTLCKIWKSDKQLKHIPFIFFTGTYLESQDEEFGSSLGAERFIFKPIKPKILMNILEEVLEEKHIVKQIAPKPLGEEMELFRRHNEILFKKLEKRMSDLEITNQKLRMSEEELRLHGEILAHMVESVHLIRAADGVIVYTNKRFDSVFRYDPGELVGKHVSIINAPGEKSPEAVADEIIRSLKQAGVWSGEVRNIRKDGHSFWCYANVTTFKHPQYGEVWISVNRDITERKLMEEELRESEEQYRSLFENAGEAIFVGQDGKLVFFNTMTAMLFGYPCEELALRPFVDFLHPDDRDMVFDRHVRRMNGEDLPQRYSFRIIHRDSGVKWVELNAVFMKWNGKPATLNFLNDITARKQAESQREAALEALRASEEKYRYLVENINDAIFTLNKEGRFTYISPVIERILGYSPEAFIGHPFRELIYPEDLPLVITAFNNVLSGIMKYNEYRILNKSGKTQWIRSSSRPNYINGNADGIIGIAVDITDQKQAEEALHVSEERFRRLSEVAFEGIAIHEKGVLLNANDRFFKMFGYEPGEVLGKQVLPMTVAPEAREFMTKQIATGGLVPYESIGLRKDGTKFPMEISIREMEYNGRNARVGVILDITSRKQAEEQLRTSHLQLRALATRLQHIREEERAIIAREIHDEMGGGLTGLKMDLSWLLRKMGAADRGDERANLIDKIHASNALIDQMISVVRRISTDLRPSILDDLGLIAALEWQLSEFTSRNEIPHEFTTTCEYINMEKDTAIAVFRIFQEALTNVVRHARATKVAVFLHESERSLFGDESLALEIKDNGAGITEEEIMNPESLGLLGMKERVLAFGGELSIRGEPGSGTTLILKIPLELLQGEPS